jgi:hypothetical protein
MWEYVTMWFEIVGWVGIILIVIAFFLVSSKKVNSQGAIYQFLNLFGAASVFTNVFHQRAWPAVALQIIWGMIAVVSLFKNWHRVHG